MNTLRAALFLTMFSLNAMAADHLELDIIKGVRPDLSSALNNDPKLSFVIDGGCREYRGNPQLTEIWLDLGIRPDAPKNRDGETQRATMYLDSSIESERTLQVCNFLRSAKKRQFRVALYQLVWKSDSSIVKYIEKTQMTRFLATQEYREDFTTNRHLLDHFDKSASPIENCNAGPNQEFVSTTSSSIR